MSKLEELIGKLCPNGVEYKKLGEVTSSINIGINPRKFFKLNPPNASCFYVTVRELNGLKGVKRYTQTDLIDSNTVNLINSRANIEVGDILFSNTGTVGKLALVIKKPIDWAVNEGIYVIKPLQDKINSRFLYYCLSSDKVIKQYQAMYTGSTLKHVTQKCMEKVKIPLPPMEIQCEIVRILDNFTELTEELTEELTARKQQYEYYRSKLLDFNEGLNKNSYKKLSQIAKISRGVRVVKSELKGKGEYPVYQNCLTPMGYYDKYNRKADTTFVISAGAAGEVGYSNVDFWAADDCITFECDNQLRSRYLYHVLMSMRRQIYSQVRKASIPRLSREAVEKVIIPVPPIYIQDRIISILDNFDSICSNINIGLPAEIEARQKQYEYYRDKLLTFKEKRA